MNFRNFKFDEHGWPVVIGLSLLIIYIILSIFTGFSAISKRFIEILTSFRKDFYIAFSLIPIYLAWFISDYYQERRGTDLGNAMSNGFMGLWVGMDWLRTSYAVYIKTQSFSFLFLKGIFAFGMLFYALFIMGEAARGKDIARYVGRIREVSSFAIMFAPMIYEIVELDVLTIVAAILFFPVIYGIAELIDYYILPASKAELAEKEFQKKQEEKETQEPARPVT